MKDFLTTSQVANEFGVTRRTVYRWLETGKIKGTKTPTGDWRIPKSEITFFTDQTAEYGRR